MLLEYHSRFHSHPAIYINHNHITIISNHITIISQLYHNKHHWQQLTIKIASKIHGTIISRWDDSTAVVTFQIFKSANIKYCCGNYLFLVQKRLYFIEWDIIIERQHIDTYLSDQPTYKFKGYTKHFETLYREIQSVRLSVCPSVFPYVCPSVGLSHYPLPFFLLILTARS